MVIATHGRGFYVLDNVGILREMGAPVTQSSAYLFKPADVTRSVSRATFDYYLASPPSDLRLEILDSTGSVIRALTGATKTETPQEVLEDEDGPPPPVRTVPAKNGINRFVWDMRAAPSHDFPGLIMYQANVHGPVAPPGRYQVRLTAAGKTLTQAFAIRKDPRLTDVTEADLTEQYRFAREIQDKFSLTNDTVTRIRRIKAEITDRIERAKNESVTSTGNKLADSLTEIEGHLYQYRNRATKDPLNYPPQLNNKLGSLLLIVESADARPTDSSYVVYKELSAAVDRQLADLADLLGRDLTVLNTALAAAHLAPIPGL